MARKTMDSTALLRSICVLFMVFCILFFILPHAHQCGGDDCPLCLLKNLLSEVIFAVCFLGMICVVASFAGNVTYLPGQSAAQTLVHLKVKLSD